MTPVKSRGNGDESPDSSDLQMMLNSIASEAKKRNPNGFTSHTTPSKAKHAEEPIYEPFVTPSGQHILFYNGKYRPISQLHAPL